MHTLSVLNFPNVNFSSQADVILLMTCSIRDNAEQKIWNMVNIYKGLKRRGGKKKPLKIGILGLKSKFSAILSSKFFLLCLKKKIHLHSKNKIK